MKILITGASGFLGAETVRLAAEQGHEVRAMIRPASPRRRVPLPDEHIYYADLSDPRPFPGAVAGMEALIHCAARTSSGAADEAESRRINVEGSKALFAAARAAGVRRWIQISSMSAHPASTSAYGRTKLAVDGFLRGMMDEPDVPRWTILRPSLIYGPGGKGLVDKTAQLLQRLPVAPVVGSGRELLRPVYVADVAGAALRCLELDATIGKTYMLGGADEVSLNEFIERLGRALGRRRPLLHLPLPLCLALARVVSFFFKNPPLSVDNVLGVCQLQRVDQTPAEKEWGYHPLGLEEGLRRSFRKP